MYVRGFGSYPSRPGGCCSSQSGSRVFGLGQSAINPTSLITAGASDLLNIGQFLFSWSQQQGAEREDTTNFANMAETQMAANTAAYQSCQISQAQAIQNFNTIWTWLVGQCSQPQFGSAGGACVQDRQAGGKFDWFAGYLTPIQTGPAPQCAANSPAMTAGAPTGSSSTSGTIFGVPTIYAVGGLLLAALFLGGGE
jgi:hypothetical protein